jgi:hypothetical protein
MVAVDVGTVVQGGGIGGIATLFVIMFRQLYTTQELQRVVEKDLRAEWAKDRKMMRDESDAELRRIHLVHREVEAISNTRISVLEATVARVEEVSQLKISVLEANVTRLEAWIQAMQGGAE